MDSQRILTVIGQLWPRWERTDERCKQLSRMFGRFETEAVLAAIREHADEADEYGFKPNVVLAKLKVAGTTVDNFAQRWDQMSDREQFAHTVRAQWSKRDSRYRNMADEDIVRAHDVANARQNHATYGQAVPVEDHWDGGRIVWNATRSCTEKAVKGENWWPLGQVPEDKAPVEISGKSAAMTPGDCPF